MQQYVTQWRMRFIKREAHDIAQRFTTCNTQVADLVDIQSERTDAMNAHISAYKH